MVSFLLLALGLLLFIFRQADDNRLTSWAWIFASADAPRFALALALSIMAGLAFSMMVEVPAGIGRPALLFALSFLATACFWQEPEVIVDAARYFTQAKQLALFGPGYFYKEWGREVFAWTDLPLIPFCYGLIFRLCGEARVFIQVFNSLLFSATVLLTWLWGRSLWDEDTGLHAGLLLLGFPFLLTQVPLMLVDVATMFLLLLALYLFTQAVCRGGVLWQICAAVAIALAFFAKFSNWLYLSGLVAIFLVALKPDPWQAMRRTGIVLGLSLLLISLLLAGHHEVISQQLQLLREYQQPGLSRWSEGWASTFLYQSHPLLVAAAAYALWQAIRRHDWRLLGVGFCVALIFLLGIKRIRYTLPVFPMLALAASRGLQDIHSSGLRRFVVCGIACSSLALALLAYLPFLKAMSEENIANAAAFLESIDVDQIEVIHLPAAEGTEINPAMAAALVDLYSSRQIRYNSIFAPPPPPDYKESSLRFTWEYPTPSFYLTPPSSRTSQKPAVMVISGSRGQALPAELSMRLASYSQVRTFDSTTGIFRYQTYVIIYF